MFKIVQGHIYVITNKVNGKQYVGQTSRNIDTRFEEHCYDDRSTSSIHQAILKYGVNNFFIEELEQVDLSLLDEREQYWIQKLDTYRTGYNQNRGGNQSLGKYNNVLVIEANILVDSCEYLGREIVRVTNWAGGYVLKRLRKIIDTDKDFCGYHFKSVKANRDELTDIVDLENWIKTLNAKFQGQHIYCEELDKQFNTIGECARYLIDNNYYTGDSTQPIQNVISIISRCVKNDTTAKNLQDFHFYRAPGTTKQPGNDNPFQGTKIICPELDNKIFESQMDAVRYFIDNGIWTGIKAKTAKCRISDVVNGIFPDYRGYTFKKI